MDLAETKTWIPVLVRQQYDLMQISSFKQVSFARLSCADVLWRHNMHANLLGLTNNIGPVPTINPLPKGWSMQTVPDHAAMTPYEKQW